MRVCMCVLLVACGSSGTDPADSSTDSPTDASSDTIVTGDGGKPIPTPTITNLVLWLDAEKGVTANGDMVTAWADQSPQKNDASVVAAKFPPTKATMPIGGHAAVHFHAGGNQVLGIKDNASLQWGSGDYAIATVSRFSNDPSKGSTFGIGGFYVKIRPAGGFGLVGNAEQMDDAGSFITPAAGFQVIESNFTRIDALGMYNDGKPRLYLCRRASGMVELRLNGMSIVKKAAGEDVSAIGSDVGIGASTQGAVELEGDIAELVAVKGTLSDSDLAMLESYWMSKYGL